MIYQRSASPGFGGYTHTVEQYVESWLYCILWHVDKLLTFGMSRALQYGATNGQYNPQYICDQQRFRSVNQLWTVPFWMHTMYIVIYILYCMADSVRTIGHDQAA